MMRSWFVACIAIWAILDPSASAVAQKRLFNSSFANNGEPWSLAVIPMRADDEVRCDSVISQMFAEAIDPNVMYDTHAIRWALYKDPMANAFVNRLSSVSYANNELAAFPSLFDVLSDYEWEYLWATLAYADFVLVPAKCQYRTTGAGEQFVCNISFEVRLYHLAGGEMVLVMRDDITATGTTGEEAAAAAERKFVLELISFIESRI